MRSGRQPAAWDFNAGEGPGRPPSACQGVVRTVPCKSHAAGRLPDLKGIPKRPKLGALGARKVASSAGFVVWPCLQPTHSRISEKSRTLLRAIYYIPSRIKHADVAICHEQGHILFYTAGSDTVRNGSEGIGGGGPTHKVLKRNREASKRFGSHDQVGCSPQRLGSCMGAPRPSW